MKLKERKVIFIGEDGKPETNADGTFKTNDLYRGFTDQEAYTKQFKKNIKNVSNREQEALKKYNVLKKDQEIEKLLQDSGIDSQFIDLIKKGINKDDDIKNIKNSLTEILKKSPRMKKVLDTGGSNLTKDDETHNNPEKHTRIIG